MAKRDYYDVLGLGRSASDAELKNAFRNLAKQHHPDRNPGDKGAEARFKEVNEAYEVLRDPQKKAAYDQFGHQAFEAGMGGGRAGAAGAGFDFTSFADVFDDLFGDFIGGNANGQRRRGGFGAAPTCAPIRRSRKLSPASGRRSVSRRLSLRFAGGSGARPAASPWRAQAAAAPAECAASKDSSTVERTCPTCQGTGRVIKSPCRACGGNGVQQREKTLAVNIPAGVEDGTRIRLSGEGEAAIRGGQPGDLYIFVTVAPHRLFRREGPNIFCRVPIPMATAALGGQVEVPTIEGRRLRIAVPAGTQAGKQIRLKSKGMSELHGHARGDMFVEIVVETPINLTKRQQELLREFEKSGNDDAKEHQPESEGFFAKVKELWDDLRE